MSTRILLVEDDDPVRAQFKRVLTEAGYEVDDASDGDEGLAALRKAKGAYALVVTDVQMPSLSGDEMIAQAGAALGKARVLYLAGAAAPSTSAKGAAFLAKPVGAQTLVQTVKDLLAA
jgi:two-component system cell cycle response regulator CpdR